MPMNDNDPATLADPHGLAALLLAESLIHGLRETGALTAQEAVEIAKRAVDVQRDHAESADGAAAPLWRSHALLSAIAASLLTEIAHPLHATPSAPEDLT